MGIRTLQQGKMPGPALGSQELHAELQAEGRVAGKLEEKELGVLVNSN